MAAYTNDMLLDRLYQQWFDQADVDRDGRISGPEAVSFFISRAGLPQSVLGQVWAAGSRGQQALDRGSFRTICQLIWYAQNNGNTLPSNSQTMVAKIVSGMATLPPPRLEGLQVPTTLSQMTPIGVVMPTAVGFTTLGYGSGATGPVQRASQGGHAGPTGGYQRDMQQSQYGQQHGASQQYQGAPPGQFQGGQGAPPGQFQGGPSGQFSGGPTGQFSAGQFTGGSTSQFSSGHTGQFAGGHTGQFGAANTGQPAFPAITPLVAQKYAEGWKNVDKDAAGNVPGGAVLKLVASVPVDRTVKKRAWDLVAGSKNALTSIELFTMLYVLDLFPTAGSIPDQIPPGIFPPGVHQCFQTAGIPVPGYLQPPTVASIPTTQQNPVENLNLIAEAQKDQTWSMAGHAPKTEDSWQVMPHLPSKAQYSSEAASNVYSTDGRLPKVNINTLAAMGDTSEAQRLQRELATAGEKDRAVWEHEQSLAADTNQAEFYTKALQELILFKGRSERTLLDVQSRADAAKREAHAQKLRYEQVYEGARHASSHKDDLQKDITDAMRMKAEWESKLSVLTQELQSLASATPETLVSLGNEISALEDAVQTAELDKADFETQTSGLRMTQTKLNTRLTRLRERLYAAKSTTEKCESQVLDLKTELDESRAEEDATKIPSLLTVVASLYRELHKECREASLDVPMDAALTSNKDVVWREDDLLGASDWMDFNNEGWALVENLPGLPDGFSKSYYITLAEQQPLAGLMGTPPPNAYGEYIEPEVDESRTAPPVAIVVPTPEATPAVEADSAVSDTTNQAPMDTSPAADSTADSAPPAAEAPPAIVAPEPPANGDAAPVAGDSGLIAMDSIVSPVPATPASTTAPAELLVASPVSAAIVSPKAVLPSPEEAPLAVTFSGMLAQAKPAEAAEPAPPVDMFASMLNNSTSGTNLFGSAAAFGGGGSGFGGSAFGAGVSGGALPADLFSEPASGDTPQSQFGSGVTGKAQWTAF